MASPRNRLPPAIEALSAELAKDLESIQKGELPQSMRPRQQPTAPAPADDLTPDPLVTEPDPQVIAPEPVIALGDDEGTYKERFERLQRKLEAERQEIADKDRLKTQILHLEDQIANLTNTIMRMRQSPPAVASEPVATVAQTSGFKVSQKMRDLLGNDEVANEFESDIRSSISAAVSPVASAIHETAQQRFMRELQRLVPNIAEINAMPKFVEWCNARDTWGRKPQDAFDAAVSQSDEVQCAKIYKTFLQEEGLAAALPAPPEITEPAVSAARQPLNRRVAPGTAPTAAAPSKPAVKTYLRKDIDKVELQLTKGRNDLLRTNPAELKRLSELFKDMQSAQIDGRVV